MGNLPIGQGLSVTPMQMAAAYAAIANGGILRPPRSSCSTSRRGESARRAGERVISRRHSDEIRKMLEGVLAPGGTAAGGRASPATRSPARPGPRRRSIRERRLLGDRVRRLVRRLRARPGPAAAGRDRGRHLDLDDPGHRRQEKPMPLNSVNTNIGAMVALQSLNRTNDDMALTQKRISTGMRVADAKDDGAAFAVAQSVRADVAALTSANEQLGASQGLLDTTNAALKKVSDSMKDVRGVLTKLAEMGLTTEQRDQYNAQYTALRSQIQSFVDDAAYNGKSLLRRGARGRRRPQGGAERERRPDHHRFHAEDLPRGRGRAGRRRRSDDGARRRRQLQHGGSGGEHRHEQYGNDSKTIAGQISFNKEKMDALESGLGALVDADLAKESAKLQALQIRQQLGTQSLSIANQAPPRLSLFR